jgi:steroid delta-isomerase-like uncharacterized protein
MTNAQEIIAAYLAAFNRGDWPGMLALLADDVAHDINQGATQHGKPAFATFLDHMARCYREELRDIVIMAGPDGSRRRRNFGLKDNIWPPMKGCRRPRASAIPCPPGRFMRCAMARSVV